MALDTPRWVRSARRRPAAFVAILLLSAGAVLVSAVTPMLIGAVDATTLRERVASAPFPANGISVSAVAQNLDAIPDAENAVQNALQAALTSDRWGTPNAVAEPRAAPFLFGPGRAPFVTHLSLPPDECDGLRMTGTCPRTAAEVALPSSLARTTGWGVGTAGTAKHSDPDDPSVFITIGVEKVVGIYDDRAGMGLLLADPTRLAAAAPPRSTSNLLIGERGLHSFTDSVQVTGAVTIVRPVRQSDLPGLRAAVRQAKRSTLDEGSAQVGAFASSGLPALLDAVGQQQAAAAVLATPIGLEAVLLAWFALGAVAQRTARARAVEWGVGRMRGARLRAWLAFVFSESLVAIAVGAVLGFAAALLVARLAAAALLRSADDVQAFAPLVIGGAGLAVVGSLIALVAASVRAASLPLQQLLQDSAESRRVSRAALVVQVALVSLAAAVFWVALTSRGFGGQQLGLLLPAMLALVVGIAAVRLAVALVRRTSRRAPRSLTGLVVGRGLARAPSALVAAQLVLVSAALGACALQLGLASAALQTDRAELAVGASRVLAVQVPVGTSLLQAVRRADPSGREAMAAAQIEGGGDEPGGKVLAVDVARLGAVSTWQPRWRTGLDLARLHPSTAGDLVLCGTRLQLAVTNAVHLASSPPVPIPVYLEAVLAGSGGWQYAELGTLRQGVLSGSMDCPAGCRLVALQLHSGDPNVEPWQAQFDVTSMSTDRQTEAAFRPWLRAARWRERVEDLNDPTHPAAIAPQRFDGLRIAAQDQDGGSTVQLEPAIGPRVLPAVFGSTASLLPFPGIRTAFAGTSIAGVPALVRPVGTAVAVPRALRTGVLVDLGTAERTVDPALVVASQEVWLSPGSHDRVLTALRRDGIRVLSDERASTAIADGLRSATNRAMLVAGVTALVGVVFGLLALIGTRLIDMPERRREWAVLRLTGSGAARLRRLALVQTAVPAVLGAVLGVIAGSVGASLIVARLPLLVGVPLGPPLDGAPPVGALALLAAVLVVLVLAVSAASASVEVEGDGR